MVKHSPHKKRFTLLTLLFLFLFLSLCSYLNKRLLQPKLSLYTDLSYSSLDPIHIRISTDNDDSDEAENVRNLVLDHHNAVNYTVSKGDEFVETVRSCDLYVGSWIKDDENYPIYKPGTCPYVDRAYDCQTNGREDDEYMKWRWKPDGCNIPRFSLISYSIIAGFI